MKSLNFVVTPSVMFDLFPFCPSCLSRFVLLGTSFMRCKKPLVLYTKAKNIWGSYRDWENHPLKKNSTLLSLKNSIQVFYHLLVVSKVHAIIHIVLHLDPIQERKGFLVWARKDVNLTTNPWVLLCWMTLHRSLWWSSRWSLVFIILCL